MRTTQPRNVVRRGSLTEDKYIQPDGTWGDWQTAKRFSNEDLATQFYDRFFPGVDNYGLFPCSVPRRLPA